MELSREPAVMDQELTTPEPPEAVDKTAFLTALTVLGVGMSFLVAMMFVLFPEWIRPRAFATETSTSPGRIFTLRAPSSLEVGPVRVAPVQRKVVRETVRSLPERTRSVAPADPTRSILAAEFPEEPQLPQPVQGVVSTASQILSGTILSVGNGLLTVQAGTGPIVVKIGDNTVILVNGQPRSLNDLKVGDSVTLVGATVDPTGSSSGPVTPDPASRDKGPVPGVDPLLKDIPLKIPGP